MSLAHPLQGWALEVLAECVIDDDGAPEDVMRVRIEEMRNGN